MIRLLVTSGRGPAECRLAVARAIDRMVREAEGLGLVVDCVPGPAPDRHGPGSVMVLLDGRDVERFAQDWTGPALWIAQSPLRPNHRRKNWYIAIERLEARATPVELQPQDVRFDTLRAGGPGGQHQNTTESAVRAVHAPSGFCVVARSERSQHRNKAAALERLARMLAQDGELQRMQAGKKAWAAHEKLQRGGSPRRL